MPKYLENRIPVVSEWNSRGSHPNYCTIRCIFASLIFQLRPPASGGFRRGTAGGGVLGGLWRTMPGMFITVHWFIHIWWVKHGKVGFLFLLEVEATISMCLPGRRKFRSQTSDLWAHAATVVKAVREEKETAEKESEEKESVETRSSCAKQ